MPAGYCVARPAQLADAATPECLVARLGQAAVLTLEGVFAEHDPVLELSRLVAILGGEPTGKGPTVATPVVFGTSAMTMARVGVPAVLALQGADGDPELEWDDIAALWFRSDGAPGQVAPGQVFPGQGLPEQGLPERGFSGHSVEVRHGVVEELLRSIDRLRQLAAEVQPGAEARTSLYCWRGAGALKQPQSRHVTPTMIQTALGRGK